MTSPFLPIPHNPLLPPNGTHNGAHNGGRRASRMSFSMAHAIEAMPAQKEGRKQSNVAIREVYSLINNSTWKPLLKRPQMITAAKTQRKNLVPIELKVEDFDLNVLKAKIQALEKDYQSARKDYEFEHLEHERLVKLSEKMEESKEKEYLDYLKSHRKRLVDELEQLNIQKKQVLTALKTKKEEAEIKIQKQYNELKTELAENKKKLTLITGQLSGLTDLQALNSKFNPQIEELEHKKANFSKYCEQNMAKLKIEHERRMFSLDNEYLERIAKLNIPSSLHRLDSVEKMVKKMSQENHDLAAKVYELNHSNQKLLKKSNELKAKLADIELEQKTETRIKDRLERRQHLRQCGKLQPKTAREIVLERIKREKPPSPPSLITKIESFQGLVFEPEFLE